MDDVSDYRGLPDWREDSIDKVGITDDFMLSTVLQQDPTICVDLLQYMLPSVRIHHIQFKTLDNDPLHAPPSVQQSISPTYDKHGVRMDVFYDDGKRSFAVEMQNGNNPNLPRRSRFIRSAIDVNDLSKGMDYIKLKPCYVIFICTFDPFRQGRYLYRFESRCAQDVSLMHGDEAYTLYFNTKGKDIDGELPPAMREILEYIDKPDNYPVRQSGIELIKRIDNAVKVNRQSPEWRRRYMMYQLHVMDIRREAELAGERRGEKRGEERGEKRGERRGERKARRAVIETMMKLTLPVEEIAKYTGVPLEEVLRIKREEEDRAGTALDGGEGI